MQALIYNPLYAISGKLCSAVALLTLAAPLCADDWMTWSSSYTHSPQTGQRIDQYAPGEQPISPYRQDFTRSGFRHFRSTLQAGQSADNMHIVEQWGQPVIPYEQWRFPFRPYAVPYDAWGPQAPYGIANSSVQFGVGVENWGHPGGPPSPGAGGSGYGPGGAYGSGFGAGFGAGYGSGGYQGPGSAVSQRPRDYPSHPHDVPNYPPAQRRGNWGGYSQGNAGPPYGPHDSRGFPLTPTYNREPWYDGNYPTVPPLGER